MLFVLYLGYLSLSKRVSCTRVNRDWLITIRVQHSTSYDERVLAITVQFSENPILVPHPLHPTTHTSWWWSHNMGRSSCSRCMVTGSPICKSYFLACWGFGRLDFHVMLYSMKNKWVDVVSIMRYTYLATQGPRQLVPKIIEQQGTNQIKEMYLDCRTGWWWFSFLHRSIEITPHPIMLS